jgi:hypothetical protein
MAVFGKFVFVEYFSFSWEISEKIYLKLNYIYTSNYSPHNLTITSPVLDCGKQ